MPKLSIDGREVNVPDRHLGPIRKRYIRRIRRVWMSRHRSPGQFDRRHIPVRVVGVAVRIDDVRHRHALGLGPIGQKLRRIRRVDEHALPHVSVGDQISEVSVATDANLFEDELHSL